VVTTQAETKLTGPHLDEFTFIGHSDGIVAALDPANEVALTPFQGPVRAGPPGRQSADTRAGSPRIPGSLAPGSSILQFPIILIF
jgi:hypothetical protein